MYLVCSVDIVQNWNIETFIWVTLDLNHGQYKMVYFIIICNQESQTADYANIIMQMACEQTIAHNLEGLNGLTIEYKIDIWLHDLGYVRSAIALSSNNSQAANYSTKLYQPVRFLVL